MAIDITAQYIEIDQIDICTCHNLRDLRKLLIQECCVMG